MAIVTGLSRAPRRSDEVLAAVRNAIEKRRNLINEANVRSVTFVVKLKNGTDTPRVVLTNIETEDELTKGE